MVSQPANDLRMALPKPKRGPIALGVVAVPADDDVPRIRSIATWPSALRLPPLWPAMRRKQRRICEKAGMKWDDASQSCSKG
jgi:hypothetical protein